MKSDLQRVAAALVVVGAWALLAWMFWKASSSRRARAEADDQDQEMGT